MSLNIGFITWIIKKNAFVKFHTCKMGESMLSEEVTTQNMQWYLKCFPNGSKHKFEGWVGLSLTLKKTSIASNITNVLVRYYLYESQSSSISRGIARFNKNNSVQELQKDKMIINELGYAKSNGTNYLVEVDSLKKYDIIILKCEFEIIRMYKLNKLIYGYPLKLNKIISYQWNISNKHLDKFKITQNPYTRLYSQEFNVWNLVLVPSATTYNSKGNISLRLRLYELPPIVSSIRIIVVLSCKQFCKSWTSIATISYEQPWIAWPANTLKKSTVEERIFDEKRNNIQHGINVLTFECKIEILSVTLYKLQQIHNLCIKESDSKYKHIWNKFIMDDNNIFMRAGNENESKMDEHDMNDMNDYYQHLEDDDEYLICKKEDFIRQNILKSLDLTEPKQKRYLMAKYHSMQENIRVLRKEKERNTAMLKQLQSMCVSLQKNLKSMQRQIDGVSRKKSKDDDNELFIKRLKKEKAKRNKEKKKKKKSSKDLSKMEEKEKERESEKAEAVKTANKPSPGTPKAAKNKKKGLTAKQQLFKTWMDMVVNLPQYFELFVDSGYEDLTYVENMQLTEPDLIQIGIQKRGHRQKILQEIKKMKPKKKEEHNEQNASNMDMAFTSINNTDIGGGGGAGDGMGDDLYLHIGNQDDNQHETGW